MYLDDYVSSNSYHHNGKFLLKIYRAKIRKFDNVAS